MIRWYDYIVAFLFAHLIYANILIILYGTTWWHPVWGFLVLFGLNDLWVNGYSKFRKSMEDKKNGS